MMRNCLIFIVFKFIIIIGLIQGTLGEKNQLWNKSIIETNNKVCTLSYADNQPNYEYILRKLTGLTNFNASKILKLPKLYTGFKLIKKHYVKNGMIGLSTNMSFNYCQEGKLLWSREFPITNQNNEFNWNNPICIYLDKNDTFSGNNNNNNMPKLDKTQKLTNSSSKTVLRQIQTKLFGFLKIESPGTKIAKNTTPSLKDLALKDVENVFCFKYARRKLYANQSLGIFFPQQWVGGLFYCDLSNTEKHNMISSLLDDNLNFMSNNTSHNFCTIRNCIPLLPVVADQYQKFWSENTGLKTILHSRPKKPYFEVVKNVPYLYTPHSLNIIDFQNLQTAQKNLSHNNTYSLDKNLNNKFTQSWKFKALDIFRKTPFMKKNKKWFNEVNVQETYSYKQEDLNKLEKLVQFTLKKLQNISDSESFKKYSLWDFNEEVSKIKKLQKFNSRFIYRYIGLEDIFMGILGSKFFKKDIEDIKNSYQKLKIDPDHVTYSVPI